MCFFPSTHGAKKIYFEVLFVEFFHWFFIKILNIWSIDPSCKTYTFYKINYKRFTTKFQRAKKNYKGVSLVKQHLYKNSTQNSKKFDMITTYKKKTPKLINVTFD